MVFDVSLEMYNDSKNYVSVQDDEKKPILRIAWLFQTNIASSRSVQKKLSVAIR